MDEMVNITIDGSAVRARAGDKLLWVALENSIYIPHLCAIKELSRPNAGCRLCFVEIEGVSGPVTSCTYPVGEGMVVKTRGKKVDRLVKTAFELLLSDHNLQCRECPANRACELQKIARERGLKLQQRRFKSLNKVFVLDDSPGEFAFDRSRCVLCGQCVWVDREVAAVGAIGFVNRGVNRVVTTFQDVPLAESNCTECALCVKACPVGALYFREGHLKK
ncbi:MAG TPA: 2Fe-2S iron-sulfur cluster-binding protein [Candidatus Limnocylindrales bacterium]|nr:2Fe-2S iron-sulfur cluster-binding protein [Candidatus Limnocylindrales bacterium]